MVRGGAVWLEEVQFGWRMCSKVLVVKRVCSKSEGV